MSGNFIYRHHVEPIVKLYSPIEDSFSCSTEVHWRLQNNSYELGCYARKTHRWLLEHRWIKRFVSWTGFPQFTPLSEKPPDGYMWSGRRLTKRQATSRPDHLWPELWRGMARNAKLWEKQKWAIKKPKLDNARRLRGIYFIDPEDKEFKETAENARRKLETPMAPTMPCKTCKKSRHGETRGKTSDFNSSLNLRVSWKPVNPKECVWKNLYQNIMRTILQEKETIHYNNTNLFLCLKQWSYRSKSSSG